MCTCTSYFKKNSCKHIVAICSMKNLFPEPTIKIPIESKTVQVGKKRERGRPGLVKKQHERNEELKLHSQMLDDEDIPQPRAKRQRKK